MLHVRFRCENAWYFVRNFNYTLVIVTVIVRQIILSINASRIKFHSFFILNNKLMAHLHFIRINFMYPRFSFAHHLHRIDCFFNMNYNIFLIFIIFSFDILFTDTLHIWWVVFVTHKFVVFQSNCKKKSVNVVTTMYQLYQLWNMISSKLIQKPRRCWNFWTLTTSVVFNLHKPPPKTTTIVETKFWKFSYTDFFFIKKEIYIVWQHIMYMCDATPFMLS